MQEKQVAESLQGKVQPNSGATTFKKGDVVLDRWLIECKTCVSPKQSFSIRKEWFEKNKREAIAIGKSFTAIAFNFGPKQKNYYIIDETLFKTFLEYLEQDN